MGVRATPLSEALTLEGGKLRDCDLLQTRTLRYPAIAIAPNPSPCMQRPQRECHVESTAPGLACR